MRPPAEIATLRHGWPPEFNDGARWALLSRFDGHREAGGYSSGFHRWPLPGRNAWFAGFNKGYHDGLRLYGEAA
jgi:hypothetical protein